MLFFENCEKAAGLRAAELLGSAMAGAKDVPLMPSLPATVRGSGSPASSARVGNMSTISARTPVSLPTELEIQLARMMRGMCTPSSNCNTQSNTSAKQHFNKATSRAVGLTFVIFAQVSCSPSW